MRHTGAVPPAKHQPLGNKV